MNVEDIRTLYEHYFWANERLLNAVAQLPADQFATAALGPCALRPTLVHLVNAIWTWRSRWQGTSVTTALEPEAFPTLGAVLERWQQEDELLRPYLASLTDEQLQERFDYRLVKGTPFNSIRWHTLVQVANHATQHRAEIALLLTELGYSPGDLDFIMFARAKDL